MATAQPATDPDMQGVNGILLAAGSSQRFGQDKQAAVVDGQPLLVRAAHTLLAAGFALPIVVLGPESDPRTAGHRHLLAALPLRLIENPAASTGMASSLRAAIESAGACEAIVVTVCDQPAVTASHLRGLVQRWRQGGCTLVASAYGPPTPSQAYGVPALINAQHFPELHQLTGDRGAGPLLARHADDLALLPLPEGALDLDTPEDLERYTRQHRTG